MSYSLRMTGKVTIYWENKRGNIMCSLCGGGLERGSLPTHMLWINWRCNDNSGQILEGKRGSGTIWYH